MATASTFRNVNILVEINAENTTEASDIYTPGILNPYDLVAGIKYFAFITSLRMIIDIKSISEFILPEVDTLDSDEKQRLKIQSELLVTPRKCLCLYMRTSSNKPVMLAEIWLTNRSPYYFTNLLNYLSNASTADIAPDTVITIQMKDIGYGLLQDKDRVGIIGSAVEEASLLSTQSSVIGD